MREGVTVAIVGPPNAGKSSLLNALLGEERAIVSEIAGTTRDTIEESIAIDDVPVRIVDTAGIRAHADRLEAAGIERTRRALDAARLALVVIDGSRGRSAEARARSLDRTRGRDARGLFQQGRSRRRRCRGFGTDAVGVKRAGPADDRRSRARSPCRMGGEDPDRRAPASRVAREVRRGLRSTRSARALRRTLARGEPVDLIAGELQRAIAALGHVTENVAAEGVLDR